MATSVKIAIQGGPASFHDAAARQFVGTEAEIQSYPTFRLLCDALAAGAADYGVMAIENNLAGSILTNYSLLQQYSFSIQEELWLSVDQNLMALPGQQLRDIRRVMSHPVALLQCGNFLHKHPYLQLQETTDTADSAREISENQLKGVAAIASKQAAALYGLTVLSESIADRPDNRTRFLLLCAAKPPRPKAEAANKASLVLELPRANGALGEVMHQLHDHKIHVSLIQSLPTPVTSACHYVAIDLVCTYCQELQTTVDNLKPLVQGLQVLGLYEQAPTTLHPRQSAEPIATKPIKQ